MQYHFIGIGGIGMSALAHFLLQKNAKVSGSDLKETHTTQRLLAKGAKIFLGPHREDTIQPSMVVVRSSAVSENNPEILAAKKLQLPIYHRSECLNFLMQQQLPLLVSGTHGKTTTTSLLAWVLSCGGYDPSFIIGGIPFSFGTNGYCGSGKYFVAETDESDGSFLSHRGEGAIVTNIDFDHLDFWKTKDHLIQGFKTFINQINNPELLFLCGEDAILRALCIKGTFYGFSSRYDLFAYNIGEASFKMRFNLVFEGKKFIDLELNLIGQHNLLNALAVFGMAMRLGVKEEDIRIAFKTFEGVGRRSEKKGEIKGIQIFDDYAHHPTEVVALLTAFKQIAERESKRLVIVFQPHRYTRMKHNFHAFSTCFKDADVVILTDIYSAGEMPIKGVSSQHLFEQLKKSRNGSSYYVKKEELEEYLVNFLQPQDLVLTVGAGDITQLGLNLLHRLKNDVEVS